MTSSVLSDRKRLESYTLSQAQVEGKWYTGIPAFSMGPWAFVLNHTIFLWQKISTC